MAFTDEQLINSAYEMLRIRGGDAVQSSMLPRIAALLRPALDSLSRKVARDPMHRHLLKKEFVFTLSAGVADLSAHISGVAQPLLLAEMRHADIRHPSSPYPVQMLADRSALSLDRRKLFVYAALDGTRLLTRDITGSLTALTGNLTARASFVATLASQLPDELWDMAVAELAGFAAQPPAESAAA